MKLFQNCGCLRENYVVQLLIVNREYFSSMEAEFINMMHHHVQESF